MGDRHQVVVIGGGQAGLAISYCLKQHGIEHVVLEKHRVAHEWRERRWDSFCLVTPNWQCRLPGHPYRGPEPTGFMGKDAIVQYVLDYVRSFQPPLFEGVAATALRPIAAGGFLLETTAGSCRAEQIVVATGGYHIPQIPRLAERIPDDILQIHSSAYRRPEALPPGEVLVVGSGQSGCQIAEDLHLAGRRVHLCVGSAPRTARRYRGRDVVEWLEQMGYYTLPVEEHPLKERVRAKANHYVTGRDGGRDIDLRQRAREGMRLYGRLLAARDARLTFADDLARNLDQADAVCESIKTTIDTFIARENIDAPTEARYVPVWEPSEPAAALDLRHADVTSIIWSTGFRADYRWIDVPIFNGSGYPVHHRGVTAAFGLYFIGLPWLHTWGSGRFSGVAVDAGHLADQIQRRLQAAPAPRAFAANELALGS
ncbi:MAG TPA: MSMEG_0569 family flavin-dependent oxidoreductase [Polyangia bacterium]|nr:MSMEG_0569 family flavin-dependent oxidoreductase [Polyangia bacterium]